MSQYQQDFKPPVSHQDLPGREGDLPVEAIHDKLPTADGGWQPYKAAGKLEGKKALITGGDSGIGRAITILYAMEGADSFIVYLPEEEEDAQETKRQVEKHGRKCFLMSTDLRKQENCQKVVETALKELGQVNILVRWNNLTTCLALTLVVGEQCCLPDDAARYHRYPNGTVAQDLRYQHPPNVLSLQSPCPAHEPGRLDHQLCFNQCLHWSS
jgi:hypothetical protein